MTPPASSGRRLHRRSTGALTSLAWAAVAVPAQLGARELTAAAWAALTVAVEKLLDAGLFRDDLVRRPCTLYELLLGRDLVEQVLRRRAFNVR